MKKSLVCGFMISASIFSVAAYADPNDDALTTKKYVNDGLEYVYKVANGTSNGTVKNLQSALSDENGNLINVGDLADKVGTESVGNISGTGLTGAVEDLQNTVGDATKGLVKKVNDLENSSNVYNAGAGIVVTPGTSGNPSTIGIDVPTNASDGVTYVFQSDGNGGGSWVALKVEDTWNPTFLTNP
jgi:hypothetical protein